MPPDPEIKDDKRAFGDSLATKDAIYRLSLDAATKLPTLPAGAGTIAIESPHYADPDNFAKREIASARMTGGTPARRLRADVVMRDADGKEIDRKRSTLATIPHYDSGRFVLGGTEYTLASQLRLRPGIYTRRKASGDVEAHVNVLPHQGRSARIGFDPATAKLTLRVKQADYPLASILRSTGVTDDAMRKAWGDDVFNAAGPDRPHVATKLLGTLQKTPGTGDVGADLRGVLSSYPLDPRVTAATLGKAHAAVTPEALLDASAKVVKVHKGEVNPDDRDSLAYMQAYAPEHLLAERITRSGPLLNHAARIAARDGSLRRWPTGLLSKHVRDAITHSGLGTVAEGTNPAQILEQEGRLSRMGEGGMPGSESIPEECYDADTEVFTEEGWISWCDVTAVTRFACLIDNRLEFHVASRLIAKPYCGTLYHIKTRSIDHLVTPGHRIWCRKYRSNSSVVRCGLADWKFELASEVHRRPRQFQSTHLPYIGKRQSRFQLAVVPGARKIYRKIALNDWAELVGWYAAEGSIDSYALRERNRHVIVISQDSHANPANCEQIAALLRRMGIAFSYHGHNFVFSGKQLAEHLFRVGRGESRKCLPPEVFHWPVAARRRLYDAIMKGDGSRKSCGSGTYVSTSRQLHQDVIRLATGLGYAVTEASPTAARKSNWLPIYKSYVLNDLPQGVTSERQYDECYGTVAYDGTVYCAEVPGSRLLVRRFGSLPIWSGNSRAVQPSHFGYVDFVATPESDRVGVESRAARNLVRDDAGELYAPVRDARTGERKLVSARTMGERVHELPGQTGAFRDAVGGGETINVPKGKTDYVLNHMEDAFSPLMNLIPLKSGAKPQRALMGARMLSQALPLVGAEAPLVQGRDPDGGGKSFAETYSHKFGALRSAKRGVVTAVAPDRVDVRHDDGTTASHELRFHEPSNSKTGFHQTPTVAVGQRVEPDSLLARSNFTDKNGVIALGLNARTAYYLRGSNYQDAVTISRGFADRLQSEYYHQHKLWRTPDMTVSKNAYLATRPAEHTREALDKLDDDGVAKVGSLVHHGEPLILALQDASSRPGVLHRGKKALTTDASHVWEHHDPAEVTAVHKGKDLVTVTTRHTSKARIGDKLSGFFGDKGVIGDIIPNEEMLHDEQGRPFDVLASTHGISSRVNPAQVSEATLGKIAALRGTPYVFDDFNKTKHPSLVGYAMGEALRHGIRSTTETLVDPTNGRRIPGIFTGNRYYMRLRHDAEAKLQGRGTGGYDANDMPTKGGKDGAKRVALLNAYALLSHGATSVLQDAGGARGQSAPQLWQRFLGGHDIGALPEPFVRRKFAEDLRASGIETRGHGGRLRFMPLTDRDVRRLAATRELKNAETVKLDDRMTPIGGGLFDAALTGGHGGNQWSALPLAEPLPNPVTEDAMRKLLDLSEPKFRDILAGREKLDGATGPAALRAALDGKDVDAEIAKERQNFKTLKGDKRDAAAKRLAIFAGVKATGVHPRDWFLSRAPIIPPAFRPISMMKDTGQRLVADPNILYRELHESNENYKGLKGRVDDAGNELLTTYDALKAVTGLGEPIRPETRKENVRGFLSRIWGTSPKHGLVQRKLLGATTNLVGRATAVPDGALDMDSIGIPEESAWAIYRPFVVRRLVRGGVPRVRAVRAALDRTRDAKKAMLEEMAVRPVVADRAPILHRYGVMAFKPRIVADDTLHLSPYVTKPFGGDFDGDAYQFHVPLTDAAAAEALKKMLPSKNLLSVATLNKAHYIPIEEYAAGLYAASRPARADVAPRTFRTEAEAVAAFHRGEIDANDPVRIVGGR